MTQSLNILANDPNKKGTKSKLERWRETPRRVLNEKANLYIYRELERQKKWACIGIPNRANENYPTLTFTFNLVLSSSVH